MIPVKPAKPLPSKARPDTQDGRIWLALALAIGALVRFISIAKSSIWHDEGYTMMLAPQSPAQILARTARDVHPPLYYLALHFWMLIFGHSETAARGLSAVLMLAAIAVTYALIRRLFGYPSARLAAVFLAAAPFLVRYSQEARMYGMVAFLIVLATWLLVKAAQDGAKRDWVLYSVVLAAALYTHYYAIFIIPVHWLYMLTLTFKRQPKINTTGLRDWRWWLANIFAAGLFLPWLPVAYHQFTRVQASFWIPKVGPNTIPATLGQLFTFTDLGAIPLLRVIVTLVLTVAIAAVIWQNRSKFSAFVLLVSYTLLAPLAVFALSFKRPIYVDRYFVFAAVGFYALLAVLHYYLKPLSKSKHLRQVSIAIIMAVFAIGLRNVYAQSNHQMRQTGKYVSTNFKPGDQVVSGELYTYFDFTYYNKTGQLLKLLAPDGVNGYGESSLLYDRADQIVVHKLSDLHPASGRVWVVGKTGPHDYFDHTPDTWTPIGAKFTAGYTAAQLYLVQ